MHFDTTGIPSEIVNLWQTADDLWEKMQNDPDFESYASADYAAVYHCLESLVGTATTFVEFGSGLGIVTLMADYLGFEAHGIEAKESLVDFANQYAQGMGANAVFAAGSFIPDDFEWDPSAGDESERTFVDLPDAYQALDKELSDFDLIYAYPWPTEHILYDRIVDSFARPGAIYVNYDAQEGMNTRTVGS